MRRISLLIMQGVLINNNNTMKRTLKFIPAVVSVIVIFCAILWTSEKVSDLNIQLLNVNSDIDKTKERIKFWEGECEDASIRLINNAYLREQVKEYVLIGRYMDYWYDDYDRTMYEGSYYKIYKKNGSYYCDYNGLIEQTISFVSNGVSDVDMMNLDEYILTRTSFKGYNYYLVDDYGDKRYFKIY